MFAQYGLEQAFGVDITGYAGLQPEDGAGAAAPGTTAKDGLLNFLLNGHFHSGAHYRLGLLGLATINCSRATAQPADHLWRLAQTCHAGHRSFAPPPVWIRPGGFSWAVCGLVVSLLFFKFLLIPLFLFLFIYLLGEYTQGYTRPGPKVRVVRATSNGDRRNTLTSRPCAAVSSPTPPK
jgi:hypothetical protein